MHASLINWYCALDKVQISRAKTRNTNTKSNPCMQDWINHFLYHRFY